MVSLNVISPWVSIRTMDSVIVHTDEMCRNSTDFKLSGQHSAKASVAGSLLKRGTLKSSLKSLSFKVNLEKAGAC